MPDSDDTLATMLGNAEARPYLHQKRVAELVLAGRNVILQAPTGSGKTEAALLPFLHAWRKGLDFARKCIYAVPLRVLANQFKTRADEWAQRLATGLTVSIQTGERPEDRRFEGDLVFATIDQVLSSFLVSPYSLSRSQANLNLGALVGAYLVFDEVHLFDGASTLPTTLIMLKMLSQVSPFVLMTATLSRETLNYVADFLDAVVVPQDEHELEAMLRLPCQDKMRSYEWTGQEMTADAVLATHEAHGDCCRTLVVCNTVNRAADMYRELRTALAAREADTEIVLLHSRFLKADRAEKEERLVSMLGKGAPCRPGGVIAVATQVVEVGLDISCDIMHTDLAPANSLVQRSGRCARYERERGRVFVYDIESAAPYVGAQEHLVELTRGALPSFSDLTMDFVREQKLLDCVHAEHDRVHIVEGFQAMRVTHEDAMREVMDGRELPFRLIRAVDSRMVLIHPDPDEAAMAPFAYESFSLHHAVLYKVLDDWLEREQELDLDWGVRSLYEVEEEADRYGPRFAWMPVHSREDLLGSAVVLVNPALAGYDREVGLLLNEGNGFACPKVPPREREERQRRYHRETYRQHVTQVRQAFREHVWPELARAARALERAFGWRQGSMERACSLAVCLHDAGKMTEHWQAVARRYMELIGADEGAEVVLAHTEYDEAREEHRKAQSKAGRRPPHAGEGACAVLPIAFRILEGNLDQVRAVFSAIARHHSARAHSVTEAKLVPQAVGELAWSLELVDSTLPAEALSRCANIRIDAVEDLSAAAGGPLVQARDWPAMLAYGLIVRALRLSDQMGTAAHSQGVAADAVDQTVC